MQLEKPQNIGLLTANSVIKIRVQDQRDQDSVSSSKLQMEKITFVFLPTFPWLLENTILVFFDPINIGKTKCNYGRKGEHSFFAA